MSTDEVQATTGKRASMFEGPLRVVWVAADQTPATRIDHYLIQGPRDGRFRMLLGQLIDPIVMTEEDADALRQRGTVNVRTIAAVEFGEEQARDLLALLERHFKQSGIPAGEEVRSDPTS